MPLVRGEAAEVREELFAELNYHVAYEPARCVRTRKWKYIRRYDPRPGPLLPNCDASPSKDVMLSHGWDKQAQVREALYNLVLDPNEGNNWVGNAAYTPALEEMRGRLDGWMERTDDPLRNGPMPGPQAFKLATFVRHFMD